MNKTQHILIFFLVLITNMLFAQNYGNEWINTNQTYYKINIPKTGIYRISGQELQNFGVPLGSFNPQQVQLFFKGQEIPCYIKGENIALIEYIEFYAEKNDGWFDVDMHEDSESQMNPNYSLITDTAAVFFTWSSSFNNLRIQKETDVNFGGHTPATYCYSSVREDYIGRYLLSYNDCEYIKGEGWVDPASLTLGQTLTKTLLTPDFVFAGKAVEYDLSLATFSRPKHHLLFSALGLNTDTLFYGYSTINLNGSSNVSNLNSETTFSFTSINEGQSTDYSSISYINIKYTRGFNFNTSNQFSFSLPPSGSQKTYLEIYGFDYNSTPLLFDVSRGMKISVVDDAGVLKALVPQSTTNTELILIDESFTNTIDKLSKVSFQNLENVNNSYVLISHQKLWAEAQEYASYRGGALFDIETIYNQFGYGISKHPMAIRNFMRYAYETWSVKPEFLFIIGKGYDVQYYRNNSEYFSECLVPPMGSPPSDVLLTNKIGSTIYENLIPTGRLAARLPQDVSSYLDKVKEHESNQAQEWMKHAIHFGGGSSQSEQNQFENYLKGFETSLEDSLFGGYVSTFLKTSSDPIEISKTDSIKHLINGGVSLITFFGHGYTSGFDQNIDEPSAFSNKGKYPFMIANSCYSGNVFLPQISTSEEWTLIPNKGVIGYLSVVNQGIGSYLNNISSKFYKNLSLYLYGNKVGKIINQSRKDSQSSQTLSRDVKRTIQEFTLHGDPAIVINSFDKPDLEISTKRVSFNPPNVTTQIDSFDVIIDVVNIARTTSKSFVVHLLRRYQDGTELQYEKLQKGILYKKEITFRLPVDSKKGQGLNQFIVGLDFYSQIDELNENNNTTQVSYYISSSDIFPIVPYRYNIVPSKTMALKASTGNPLAPEQTGVFQIDTLCTFDSPFLISEEVNYQGGVTDWQTPIEFEDNETYFWRTAKKQENAEDLKWVTSSFSYEEAKLGWKQSSYGQLIENDLKFLDPKPNLNQIQFKESALKLRFANLGINYPLGFSRYEIGYSIDGVGDVGACMPYDAIHIVVIDSTTFLPWRSDYADYGQSNYPECVGKKAKYFSYHLGSGNVEAQINNIINLINNVPDGFYILLYTMQKGWFNHWSELQYQTFEDWGASEPRHLFYSDPYVLFMKKGDNTQTQEWWGTPTDKITGEVDIYSNFNYGSITSKKIGPAKKWNKFLWQNHKLEDNPNELAFVNISAINAAGQETLLVDSLTSSEYDLRSLDAMVYPYVKLHFYSKDIEFKTPTQIDYWKVEYIPVTDVAINPQKGWDFYKDTVQEGETVKLSCAFHNIGAAQTDSLLVKYLLQKSNNQETVLKTKKIKPLSPNEYCIDSVLVKTIGLRGSNSILVEVNPEKVRTKAFEQPEQYHFNNFLQKSFFVEQDKSNPILDVSFDGVHIMDGDLVSSKPEIVMQLTDDNSFIALNDTSLMSFYLKEPSGTEKKISIYNNSEVVFIGGELPDNKAQIIYNHTFEKDGTYELRVRGKDKSGNLSGDFDYKISFKVINESSITHIFNYPNPFSTSTRFVFELTGSVLPDEMRIDILTVSGKLVKVIYLNDLGTLHIGKNITDYAWDGTDMYGDLLANGVYFYRVSSKINGNDIKHRSTSTSKYFKNGFGKMFLIR